MPARRARAATLFMAHVVPGLEAVAWDEVREALPGTRTVATFAGFDRRASVLLFETSAQPDALLDLRITEDVFAVVAHVKGLPVGRPALGAIAEAITETGVTSALRYHPGRPRRVPTFRVVARKAGRHAFKRSDAQRACERALGQRFGRWRLVADDAALEFWVQIVGDEALVALRLSSAEMRQRTYRQASLPGALKPTVAHALVRLARTKPGGLLVDPMCGTGTLLAEAGEASLRALGGDADPRAVRAARRNMRDGTVALWDATCLPLPDRVASALACNLPWGQRHAVDDLRALYRDVISEANRVVRPGGCIVLLTGAPRGLADVIRRVRDLEVERTLDVVVRGADARVVVARRSRTGAP